MQPADQQKRNTLIFIVASMLLLLGWMQVRNMLAPPKPPAAAEPQTEADKGKPEADKGKPEKPPAEVAKTKPEKPPAPKVPEAPRLILRMGAEEGSHQTVLLTSRGAAVLQDTLNQFQKADSTGRPVWQEDNKKVPAPLELISEAANREQGSYLLFHYGKDEARPVDTLGIVNWKVVEPEVVDPEKSYDRVVFQTELQGVRITKIYTLDPGAYHVGLEVRLESLSGKIPFRYQLTGAHGLPLEGEWYTSTFKNAIMCRRDARGNPWRDFQDLSFISVRGGGDVVASSDDKWLSYAAVVNQYFAAALVVDNDQDNRNFLSSVRPTLERQAVKGNITKKDAAEFTVTATDKQTFTFHLERDRAAFVQIDDFAVGAEVGVLFVTDARDRDVAVEVRKAERVNPRFEDDITVRVNTVPLELEPGKPVVHKYLLYHGPVKVRLLGHLSGPNREVSDDVLNRYLYELRLDTLTDYHFQGQGLPAWFGEHITSSIGLTSLLIAITNVMHAVLTLLHKIVPNYGVCIILLTLMVRGMMFPLSRKSAMTAVRMQQLAPELKKLKEKHGEDKQELFQAQMALYRKHNVSMFGSCWIVFLQMPIFLGLYYALQESIHFRLAPFLWIENLAAPDMLIRWGESIPWISQPGSYGGMVYLGPFFNLLPVIAVALQITQMSLMQPPALDEQTQFQQKLMKYMMIFFGLLFYKVAAGLCLYFITSSLWGMAERRLLPKKRKPGETGEVQQKLGLLERALKRQQELRAGNGTPPRREAEGANGDGKARRKAARNKQRKGNRPAGGEGRGPESGEPSGLFGRLGAWWAALLEAARKKNR